MRSGRLNINDGHLKAPGQWGYDWASYASEAGAFNLRYQVGTTEINPVSSNNRWFGFSLRCLSTVTDW